MGWQARSEAALVFAALSAAGQARAQEPRPPSPAPQPDPLLMATQGEAASLDPIAPTTLPDLTHADATLELDYTGAGIDTEDLGSTVTYMAFLHGEVPLTTRAWHAGAAWEVVSAAAEGRGRALLYSNPELWVRGVGWHSSGLSGGGGLGVVIPLPRDLDADERSVERLIRVIRPWDAPYFESSILTLRPSVDARLVLAPFLLQLRQGLDWSYDFTRERSDVLGRVGTFVGIAPADFAMVGLELWQSYAITKELRDDQRAAFTLSPTVRMRFGPVQPGISVLFPISTPLEGIATAFFAVRLHVRLALGKTAELTYGPG